MNTRTLDGAPNARRGWGRWGHLTAAAGIMALMLIPVSTGPAQGVTDVSVPLPLFETAKLTAVAGQPEDVLGTGVAMDADTIVAGGFSGNARAFHRTDEQWAEAVLADSPGGAIVAVDNSTAGRPEPGQ